MKLKYSIVSLLALAATLVSCEKEADHYLSEMKVSSSYVSLPKTGGDAEITITAEGPWEFSKTFDVPTGEKDDNGKDITVKKAAPAASDSFFAMLISSRTPKPLKSRSSRSPLSRQSWRKAKAPGVSAVPLQRLSTTSTATST